MEYLVVLVIRRLILEVSGAKITYIKHCLLRGPNVYKGYTFYVVY
jgi:hypothetical protein